MNKLLVDSQTPKWLNVLECLSKQERRIVVSVIRSDGTISGIMQTARIWQRNHIHAIMGRLVKKGIMMKLERSVYEFADTLFEDFLKARYIR